MGPSGDIGDAVVTHPVPRLITFTDSTAVGRHIGALAGQHVKRSALELGGNAPFIVLDDADLDVAVNAAVFGKFLNAGQICMAINRMIVDRRVHDEFLDRFATRVAALKCGDPSKEDTDLGPIIDQKQFDSIRKLVEATVAAGARVVCGPCMNSRPSIGSPCRKRHGGIRFERNHRYQQARRCNASHRPVERSPQ